MLALNDGRSELWQWDTGRKLTVDADCSQVHFSNKVFGRSIDVGVVDGVAIIPDVLLQTDKELTAWAFVGTAENGYTKISKVFNVNKRNKPADYVFTPTDQTTLGEILDRIEDLENRPSGDVSKEDIQDAVNDYLDKNPVSVEEKDPTVPNWAKQPNPPKQPNALPNPHKLTFTGAVEAEYDGSKEITVEIPEGDTGGGLTITSRTLLMTVLRNGVYTSDQSANLAALGEALKASGGGSDEPVEPDAPKTYTITNALTNCTNSNSATSIEENTAYTAVITAVDGYELQSVVVTMGGSAVTVNGGTISIPAVTGNIFITAVAIEATPEIVEEELDLRLIGGVDTTTYVWSDADMSKGTSAAVYCTGAAVGPISSDGNAELRFTLDTTKVSKYKFRLFLYNNDGTPYKASDMLGSYSEPNSGDLTHSILLRDPGNVGRVYVNGDWSYKIPDGYSALVNIEFADALQNNTVVDETILDNTGKVYDIVDKVVFDGEIIHAYVVREG